MTPNPLVPSPRTLRRALLIALFVALVVLFRHLLVLLALFVAFERPLSLAAQALARRTGIHRAGALLGCAVVLLAAVTTFVVLGIERAVAAFPVVKASLPERIEEFKGTPLFAQLQAHLHGADRLVEGAQHYAANAVEYLASFGHLLVYAVIAFILAIIFLLEHDDLEDFARNIDPASWKGTLLRWLGYLTDAISVTLQFQLVVALCNAVLTLPVLLFVGIRHATAFFLMIFISGMIPVAGNFVAGGILTLLAYQARGWPGAAIFVGLTFVLHKLESYYLNPRLASRHVRLPGFVLVVSLILWEHLLGFVGLFVSFPFLYVVKRIHSEFAAEDADVDIGTMNEPEGG